MRSYGGYRCDPAHLMTLKPESQSELIAQRRMSVQFALPLRNWVDKPDPAAFWALLGLAAVVLALVLR